MPEREEPKVSVVIPTWKRADLLGKCLESLRRQTYSDFQTVLVSNGAGDWVDLLAREFGCAMVKFPENRGFAAAVNAGIRAGIAATDSPYVALLNDDAELDPNWLRHTVALLNERADLSFCCGKIYQAEGALLDDAGDALSLGGSAWRLGFGRKDCVAFDLLRPVWAVSGTATLFRRSVFDRVGLFDEDYFSYLEDMDFSLRAVRAGLPGAYLPQAVCRHRGSATLGASDTAPVFRLLTRNQLLLLAKNFPGSLLVRLAPRIVWAQVLWAFLAMRKGRLRAYLWGVVQFLRLLPGVARYRSRWSPAERQALLARLRKSEREIYADVTAPDRAERDTFWRLYFGLFPPGNKREATAQEGLGRLPAG